MKRSSEKDFKEEGFYARNDFDLVEREIQSVYNYIVVERTPRDVGDVAAAEVELSHLRLVEDRRPQ